MKLRTGRQYETYEFCFAAPAPQGDCVDIGFSASIGKAGEPPLTIRGFYAGDGHYKLRFLPEGTGDYTYRLQGPFPELEEEGTLRIEPAAQGRHGPVRADGIALRYADGTWFPSFGTTIYALANQSQPLIEETLDTLSRAPFNKLRTCVFPKHYQYNANNPERYPFEVKSGRERKEFSAEGLPVMPVKRNATDDYWDTTRPCFPFWDHLEEMLRRLDGLGIQVDLILFHPYDRWGFASMSREDNLRYLDYLLRRLSAFPNLWWSLANEYDLCFNKTGEDFRVFEAFIGERDPYRHLCSNHNCFQIWDASSEHITHVSWQTKMLSRVAEMIQTYRKPVLIDECRYEGDLPEFWGNLSGKDMVRSFWRVMAQGGYCTHGETWLPGPAQDALATKTGEKDVVWWAKGGRLNGESPARIAFLRQVIEGLPGPLEPLTGGMKDWAAMDDSHLHSLIASMPEDFGCFLNSIAAMNREERLKFFAVEYSYQGHCGEEAYLYYLDDQCAAAFDINLPERRQYRIEVLDTWEMTRTTAMSGVNGSLRVALPGKPYMAVLAISEEEGG
jgi:hypothetical protein